MMQSEDACSRISKHMKSLIAIVPRVSPPIPSGDLFHTL